MCVFMCVNVFVCVLPVANKYSVCHTVHVCEQVPSVCIYVCLHICDAPCQNETLFKNNGSVFA